MARYRMRIRTDWAAGEAFTYLSDLTNFADWDPGIEYATQEVGHGPGIGAEYDVEASGSVLRYVVEAYDRPHRIRARGRNRWLTSIDTISVTTDGAGSLVTYDAELELRSILRIGDPILARMFRKMGDRARDGLQEKLGGTVVD